MYRLISGSNWKKISKTEMGLVGREQVRPNPRLAHKLAQTRNLLRPKIKNGQTGSGWTEPELDPAHTAWVAKLGF